MFFLAAKINIIFEMTMEKCKKSATSAITARENTFCCSRNGIRQSPSSWPKLR